MQGFDRTYKFLSLFTIIILTALLNFSALSTKTTTESIKVSETNQKPPMLDHKCSMIRYTKGGFLQISFEVSVDKHKQYQNIFQTASENEGLRLEMGVDGTSAVIISPTGGKLIGVVTPVIMKINSPSFVTIVLTANNELSLTIDGITATKNIVMERSIRCNDLVLGYGFDKSRTFEGTIRTFSIELRTTVRILTLSTILQLLIGALIGTSMLVLLLLRMKTEKILSARRRCDNTN